MLVQVKVSFYDGGRNRKKYSAGQLLNYQDDVRAKKLVDGGFVVPVEIVEVAKKEATKKKE